MISELHDTTVARATSPEQSQSPSPGNGAVARAVRFFVPSSDIDDLNALPDRVREDINDKLLAFEIIHEAPKGKKRQAAAKESISKFESAKGADADAAKAQADKDIAAVGEAIAALEKTLGGK